MNCPYDARDRVRFAYGEMEQEEAEEFRIHLSRCHDCHTEVANLQNLASITERITNQPGPEIAWDESIPRLAERRPKSYHKIWAWSGAVGTMAVSAVAVFVLLSHIQPEKIRYQNALSKDQDVVQEPIDSVPETNYATRQASPKTLVLASGNVRILRKGAMSEAIPHTARLMPGDRLSSTDKAFIRTDDGSRLMLVKKSTLALVANDDRGERWELVKGALACRVTPRSASRPFAVLAGPGVITVKGTRFALELDHGTLWVAVKEGIVEVAVRGKKEAMVDLHAGQQATLNSKGMLRVSPMEKRMEVILEKANTTIISSPDMNSKSRKPKRPHRLTLLDSATRQSKKAKSYSWRQHISKDTPKSENTTRQDHDNHIISKPVSHEKSHPSLSAAKSSSTESSVGQSPPIRKTHSLSEMLSENTNWIFDGIKSDIRARKFDDALRKLNNYLDDPTAPHADEALFLKGLCLEQMGNKTEAVRVFVNYLQRWPGGKRSAAVKSKLSVLR